METYYVHVWQKKNNSLEKETTNVTITVKSLAKDCGGYLHLINNLAESEQLIDTSSSNVSHLEQVPPTLLHRAAATDSLPSYLQYLVQLVA